MKVKNFPKLVLTDRSAISGEVSPIGRVLRDKGGDWLFDAADDWHLSPHQLTRIAALLEALKACDQ